MVIVRILWWLGLVVDQLVRLNRCGVLDWWSVFSRLRVLSKTWWYLVSWRRLVRISLTSRRVEASNESSGKQGLLPQW